MTELGEYSRIHIRVKCRSQIGQSVAVIGLGISKFQKLVTSPQSYPIWSSAAPIIVPRGMDITYRYGLIEAGVLKMHEPKEKVRKLIADEDDVVIEDECDVETIVPVKTDSKLQDSYKTMAENDENVAWNAFAASKGRLFLVCYHLPVVIKRTSNPEKPFDITWAESLIAKTAGSVSGSITTMWFGTISISLKDLSPSEHEYLSSVLTEMNCIPVFLDDAIASAAYYGFCKGVMWPVFHNVDQLDQIHAAWNLPQEQDIISTVGNLLHQVFTGSRPRTNSNIQDLYQQATTSTSTTSSAPMSTSASTAALSGDNDQKTLEWNKKEVDFHEAFRLVNVKFAQTLLPYAKAGDVIWVHDYHLMLLPKLLRDELTNVSLDHLIKIIFFLHIPFPTSQIFRTLPEATELLQSMVNADLVGFHAFDHARHFLNAAKRILGVKSATKQGGMLTLLVQEREVIVTMSHVSIETDRFDAVLKDPETHALAEKIKTQYNGRKIILGIDVCQRLSGIALKMAGYEKLLSDYSSTEKSSVVLIQRSICQGSRPEDEETTSNDTKKMVQDINSKYSRRATSSIASVWTSTESTSSPNSPLIDYDEVGSFRGLSLRERVALYLAADVFLLTPIREGLNLMPLEYIYVRKNLPRAGVVVVSEFSTCSSLLNGSLKVNPFSATSIADSLEKALSMSTRDCEYRRQRDMPFISSHPSSLWTKQILGELAQLKLQQQEQQRAEQEQNRRSIHIPHGIANPRGLDTMSNDGSASNTPNVAQTIGGRAMSFRFASSSVASAYSTNQFLTKEMLNSVYRTYSDGASFSLDAVEEVDEDETEAPPPTAVEAPFVTKAQRVFVFDYGGVLLHKERFDIYLKQTLSAISGRRPTEGMMEALRILCSDPLNVVVMITGLTKLKMGEIFSGKDFENMTLATSNGLVYSWGKNLQATFPSSRSPSIDVALSNAASNAALANSASASMASGKHMSLEMI